MQIGYSCIRKRLGVVSKHATIAIGLISLPLTMRLEKAAKADPLPIQQKQDKPAPIAVPDERTVRLTRFLSRLHCPVAPLAQEFVQAADENHLDWRLLPSISVIESGGGKQYRNNNIFGWNQGNQLFPSIRAGIKTVAFKLGNSTLYRHLDVAGKLHFYNPDHTYPGKVIAVMNRISPVENLGDVTTTASVRRRAELAYSN
jgi:hypothetical protein